MYVLTNGILGRIGYFRFTIGKHPLAWLDTIKGDNRTTTLSSSYQNGLLFEYQRECILSGHYEVARFLANQEALYSTFATYECYYNYSTGSRIYDDFPKLSDRNIFKHIRPRYLPEKMHLWESAAISLWCLCYLIADETPITRILMFPCLGYFGYEFWKVYWRTHNSMLNSALYGINKKIIKFLHNWKII